jgi:WD40 repeat protein
VDGIVCQVFNHDDRVEFIWSEGGRPFDPYVITGRDLEELRNKAAGARDALESVVTAWSQHGWGNETRLRARDLAETGRALFHRILPLHSKDVDADKVARIRDWLEHLQTAQDRTSLAIVVQEAARITANECSIPWNLVYDTTPKYSDAVLRGGSDEERWLAFWGLRYNLSSTQRVAPLGRLARWDVPPHLVVVVDEVIYKGLQKEQRAELDAFLRGKAATVGSLAALPEELEDGKPLLLYWLGHATPEYLQLGERETVTPGELGARLLKYFERDPSLRILVFLNACRTGEAGKQESFVGVLRHLNFCQGAILTERQTIDNFANEIGLDFLKGFLEDGLSVGELLDRIRLDHAPLGLIYRAHCPPEIRVGVGREKKAAPRARRASARRGTLTEAGEVPALAPAVIEQPTLPGEPYRSLAYYDHGDRLLFTGREPDVVRSAATLDMADTRILVLHGESGIGKSSFLRAGVIPYLENECIGYRFLRDPDGRLVIIQATRDPVGQLAVGLLDMTERPLEYRPPRGEAQPIDLRAVLNEAVKPAADAAALRTALMNDTGLLAKLLNGLSEKLPHALVLVLDQAEELFTFAKEQAEIEGRDRFLKLLQAVLDVRSDVKVIVSLRTEYYGRLLDHLRAGRPDSTGIRDDLLRDLSRQDLIEAIEFPTKEAELVPGQPATRPEYGFKYAPGVAQKIADGVLKLRSEHQDSVLPLVQVICTRLYERRHAAPGAEYTIKREDLQSLRRNPDEKGEDAWVAGALRDFAEAALEQKLALNAVDRELFKELYAGLYNRQANGTLTTWMKPRAELEKEWKGSMAFRDLLTKARQERLLREDNLRIEGEQPQAYIRLGHDALAKVADEWREERDKQEQLSQERERARREAMQQRRFWAIVVAAALLLALILGLVGRRIYWDSVRIRDEEARTKHQERLARARLARSVFSDVAGMWRTRPDRGGLLLDDKGSFLPSEWDFTWRHYRRLCRVLVLKGHEGWVNSLAFSADSRTLASASYDGTVRLWDTTTAISRVLEGHEGPVKGVAFSRDGRKVASAGEDGTVRLWDAVTAELRTVLPGHQGSVNAVAFSPDGRTLASAGEDSTVRLWDAVTGESRAILEGHVLWVNAVPLGSPLSSLGFNLPATSVAFSRDGKTLASSGGDSTVRLWDTATATLRATLTGHKGAVNCVAFSPDDDTLASAGRDSTVRLWGTATARALDVLTGQEGPLTSVAFGPGQQTLVSASSDGTSRLWDAGKRRWLPILRGHSAVNTVGFGPDGMILASAGEDNTVWLGDVITGESRAIFTGHVGWVKGLAFSRDGKSLASAGQERTVWLSAAATGDFLAFLSGHRGETSSVDFSPDGKTLASASGDKTVRLWDVSGPAKSKLLATLTGHTGAVNAVVFSPDGGALASASQDGTVRLWDASTWKPYAPLTGHKGPVYSVAFSPDGKTIASCGDRTDVLLWDLTTGGLGPTLSGHKGPVYSVAFSPDGKTIASASHDGTVRLWDTTTRESRATLTGHEGPVYSVAFSPDGKTIASGGDDKLVRLWDAETGEPRTTLEGHGAQVTVVVFSPDNAALASGDLAGVVRLWW